MRRRLVASLVLGVVVAALVLLFVLRSSPRPSSASAPPAAEAPAESASPQAAPRELAEPESHDGGRTAASTPVPADARTEKQLLGNVVGSFVDEGGRPLAGVDVLAEYPGFVSTHSAADGRFALAVPLEDDPGAKWGRFLIARKRGYQELQNQIEFGSLLRLDLGVLVLQAGGDLSGRVLRGTGPARSAQYYVVAASSSEPAPEAGARLMNFPNGSVRSGTVDEDGAYVLHGVVPGAYQVFARMGDTYCVPGPVVTLAAGDSLTVPDIRLVELPGELVVRGVVLDPDDQPVPGARVQYHTTGGASSSTGSITTDADARFAIALWNAADVVLRPFAPAGRPELEGEQREVASGPNDVVLRMRASAFVELEVQDTRTRPVEEFGWLLESVGPGKAENLGAFYPSRHEGGRARLVVSASAFRLRVDAPTYESAELQVTRAPGETTPIRVMLTPLPCVAGSVTRAGGEPVAHALVQLAPAELPESAVPPPWNAKGITWARTDSAGAFRISALHAGAHRLGVSGVDVTPTTGGELVVPAEGGVEGVRIVIAEGARIAGRVLVPAGTFAARLSIELLREGGRPVTARVQPDGSFAFEHLAPGGVSVRVAARPDGAGGPGPSASLELVEGRETRVELDLR